MIGVEGALIGSEGASQGSDWAIEVFDGNMGGSSEVLVGLNGDSGGPHGAFGA